MKILLPRLASSALAPLAVAALCAAGDAPVLTTYTVSNANDSGAGSLRQALADADADSGLALVTFAGGLAGQTITPVINEISFTAFSISSEVTVDASALAGGVILSGGNARRLFYLTADATVSLHRVGKQQQPLRRWCLQ